VSQAQNWYAGGRRDKKYLIWPLSTLFPLFDFDNKKGAFPGGPPRPPQEKLKKNTFYRVGRGKEGFSLQDGLKY
jgi:hypothetical protein